MSGYDPYTYNSLTRSFFMGSRGRPLPDLAAQIAADNPAMANHINSVWSFLNWMQDTTPDLYDAITNRRPELVDPAAVVVSGALGADPKKGTNLKGLRDVTDSFVTFDNSTDIPQSVLDVPSFTIGDTSPGYPAPATSWGQSILDTIKNVAPSYLQLKSQSDLMNINIKRAEQGLPPIDSATLAPTMNVGISKSAQTLGFVAVGGLVLVGLLSAMGKKRR